MQEVSGAGQPLYARLMVHTPLATIQTQFSINGKHFWIGNMSVGTTKANITSKIFITMKNSWF
uniref:Uncharacterized protein n=1 Tax=Rhizophora mucronata TaxID=61149 RepID=A0A2P2JRT4_RHIMU